MKTILWLFSLIGALAGGVVLYLGFTAANGAPQEASAAALALGCAVIPYCLARAWSELVAPEPQQQQPLPHAVEDVPTQAHVG